MWVRMPEQVERSGLELQAHAALSRCTQIPESRLFVFNPFPGFKYIVTALSSSPEDSHLQALTSRVEDWRHAS